MMEKFGEKLATLRKRRGLTLRELGELLEVDHTYISQLEKKKTKPSAVMILKIAEIFGVSTDVLMKDDLNLN